MFLSEQIAFSVEKAQPHNQRITCLFCFRKKTKKKTLGTLFYSTIDPLLIHLLFPFWWENNEDF